MNGICFLAEIKEKAKMRIVAHSGREDIARRLSDMGLAQGMECEILIPGENNSPYLIAVNESRLALEEELAKNLRVQLLGERRCRNRYRHRKRRKHLRKERVGWFSSGE